MIVFVYGTLKEGYGNNRRLTGCKKLGPAKVSDFKLYDCGFPVAWPSKGEVITGELWDIEEKKEVLMSLDSLEGEGSMYNRTDVCALDSSGYEVPAQMYVGHPKNWDTSRLRICPKNEENAYIWS